MIERRLLQAPAVALLGPRQVGKTTLAQAIAARYPQALLLDMARESDRAAVSRPELYFPLHRGRLVVLDEVQLVPQLFSALRPEIDADRRAGRFLLLGSASGKLLRQTGESLAGRVAYVELTPLLVAEWVAALVAGTPGDPAALASVQQLWLRGGYPRSLLADSDEASFVWRQGFIKTFVQRDLPGQGQLFNASQLGQSLGGASHTTTTRYLNTLVDTMMLRRLPPHRVNVGKRLVKSPKVYVRDSGLLHALLGLASVQDLQGHPVAGASLPHRRRHRAGPGGRAPRPQVGAGDQVFIGAQAAQGLLAGLAGLAGLAVGTSLGACPGAAPLPAGQRLGRGAGVGCGGTAGGLGGLTQAYTMAR